MQSINTVAAVLSNFPHQLPEGRSSPSNEGTHFTCFTGTKVQILSLVALQKAWCRLSRTCFFWYKRTNADAGGAEMKTWCRLSRTCCRFFYLFYWYKRTNTDASGASNEGVVSSVANLLSILVSMAQEAKPVLSLLAFLVQKCWYKSAVDSCVNGARGKAGTQFTCFTGTKVQILTPSELRAVAGVFAAAGFGSDS